MPIKALITTKVVFNHVLKSQFGLKLNKKGHLYPLDIVVRRETQLQLGDFFNLPPC